MWRCVIVPTVPSVSKENSAFISKGRAAHHHLADMNPQQHHCENLKSPFLHLHHALNKVIQSSNQHMHTFNFYLLKLI